MNLSKVPAQVLSYELMEYFDEEFNSYNDTIKDALEKNGEEIVHCEHEFETVAGVTVLNSLVIWTTTKVGTVLRVSLL